MIDPLLVVITVMSILSAITTGPWSRYGDVNGRKPVLVLALFGALSMQVSRSTFTGF